MYAGWNYGQMNRQTDNLITRCPRQTFQAIGIKTNSWHFILARVISST